MIGSLFYPGHEWLKSKLLEMELLFGDINSLIRDYLSYCEVIIEVPFIYVFI